MLPTTNIHINLGCTSSCMYPTPSHTLKNVLELCILLQELLQSSLGVANIPKSLFVLDMVCRLAGVYYFFLHQENKGCLFDIFVYFIGNSPSVK